MKTSPKETHIPQLGEILNYLLEVFDIPRDEDPLTYKQVQRLAKGKGLAEEKAGKVANAVLDAICMKIDLEQSPAGVTAAMLKDMIDRPAIYQGLPVNDQDKACIDKSVLLRDLIEFCKRHQVHVLPGLRDSLQGEKALLFWLSQFVVPYVCSTLVDYCFTANNPDAGMPGGRLWLVPSIEKTDDPEKPFRLVMPSQHVLLWWEDLLGTSLENLGVELCGPGMDAENRSRVIGHWKSGARPPSFATVSNWSARPWKYLGAFQDDESLPLPERWRRCRDFLIGKGMNRESAWVDGAMQSPSRPEQGLAKRYRGERLEEEIPPFIETPFRRFFESSDPVAEGLPVEALIERVACRWRVPTARQLHVRLLLGRAMTKAWKSGEKSLGVSNTMQLCRWATCAYNHYMALCIESETLSTEASMAIHERIADPADPGFHPLAAMLDERYWSSLPGYIRMWIRGEVRFKEA
jgi:hypothetical protein